MYSFGIVELDELPYLLLETQPLVCMIKISINMFALFPDALHVNVIQISIVLV